MIIIKDVETKVNNDRENSVAGGVECGEDKSRYAVLAGQIWCAEQFVNGGHRHQEDEQGGRRAGGGAGAYILGEVVWDTAGQEKYKTIPAQYFRGIQGILLVYDLTDMETFIRVQDWL